MIIKDGLGNLINLSQVGKIKKTNSGDTYKIKFISACGDSILSFDDKEARDTVFNNIETALNGEPPSDT